MLKIIEISILGLAFVFGTATVASARMVTPPGPPDSRYVFPGPDLYYGDGLYEGRSIYRYEDPGTFYGGSDEKGYPSGDPQNPRTGD